jgi:hypothetical protein
MTRRFLEDRAMRELLTRGDQVNIEDVVEHLRRTAPQWSPQGFVDDLAAAMPGEFGEVLDRNGRLHVAVESLARLALNLEGLSDHLDVFADALEKTTAILSTALQSPETEPVPLSCAVPQTNGRASAVCPVTP